MHNKILPYIEKNKDGSVYRERDGILKLEGYGEDESAKACNDYT